MIVHVWGLIPRTTIENWTVGHATGGRERSGGCRPAELRRRFFTAGHEASRVIDPTGPGAAGTPTDPELIRRIERTDSLAELAALLDAPSPHEAYVRAKAHWKRADGDLLRPAVVHGDLPGDRVGLDDREVSVHGLTHAGSDAERRVVREHVASQLSAGASVYCEEGLRDMYLADVPEACAMDDYRWAMAQCASAGLDSHVEGFHASDLGDLVADVSEHRSEIRDATFSLIESGRDIYGDVFADTLGALASSFLTSHEDLATGEDFEAFQKTRHAARDPRKLAALQRYYWHAFLPQPLEREWLRRHDRELELLTHARNERMADYVVHEAEAPRVVVLVGAAHQPGVIYYLEQHDQGRRELDGFEYVE